MGFYSVCPGTDQYVMGSPVFEKITITLEDGKKFVIHAEGNNANNVYIKSATLNGEDYTKNYIRYQDITNGGSMKLLMSDEPNYERGVALDDLPFSISLNN